MARNATLLDLLTDVRVEARLSLDPALNRQVRGSHVQLLQREQKRLWEDFAWPHLRVQRFVPLQAGQRYYDLTAALNEDGSTPARQISIDRVERIEVKSDGTWCPMYSGIGAPQYTAHDSALDERSWPPRRWKISEDEQVEVWPIPDTNAVAASQEGYLRVTGIRNLRALVADTDRADLDDNLLALYVGGSLLASKNAADGQLKLEKAATLYRRLKGSLSKRRGFNMFSTTSARTRHTPHVARYEPPTGS